MVGNQLQAPPDVFGLFRSLGVYDAHLVVPTMDATPIAFKSKFRLTADDFAQARETISRTLKSGGVQWSDELYPVRRAFGARP